VSDHEAYSKRDKSVPAVNQDTGRTVYVLPDTIKKNPEKFKALPPDKAGDPRWRGKPKPPKLPRKPEKPEVPREPPPTRIRPEIQRKKVKPTNPVKKVKPVKEMKVPEPSPKRKWKKLKKFSPTKVASEGLARTVLERYLIALTASK